PQGRDGAREPDRDRAVERADVDPELERIRRRHAEQLSVDEPPLDVTALLRRLPGSIGGQPSRCRGVEAVAREAVDELRGLATLREADRAQAAAHQFCEEPPRVPEGARADG